MDKDYYVKLEGHGDKAFQVIGGYSTDFYEHGILEVGDYIDCRDDGNQIFDGTISEIIS